MEQQGRQQGHHLHFQHADWDLILFFNKCQFNLSHVYGCERVNRLREEGFANVCIIERDCFGGGLVLVWGGIMGGNKTRLTVINGNMNAHTYINDVLAVELFHSFSSMVQVSPVCMIVPVHIQLQ